MREWFSFLTFSACSPQLIFSSVQFSSDHFSLVQLLTILLLSHITIHFSSIQFRSDQFNSDQISSVQLFYAEENRPLGLFYSPQLIFSSAQFRTIFLPSHITIHFSLVQFSLIQFSWLMAKKTGLYIVFRKVMSPFFYIVYDLSW